MVCVRILALSTIAIITKENTHAFSPVSSQAGPVGVTAATKTTEVDLSIEYDAAAKLAYNQWREEYSKGDFTEDRYDAFKVNYEVLTVANVVAAKEARESGEDYKWLKLNEYADFTADEYLALAEGKTDSSKETKEVTQETSSLGVMETMMESTAAMNKAADAIEEATAAMNEEEKKLSEKLGLESVEDLEAAIDKMDGIAEDGGELELPDVSDDIDIRSIYVSWCKKFGKEIDEARYPTFMLNYLDMDKRAKESGELLSLNMYADCTEMEFKNLNTGAKAVAKEDNAEAEVEDAAISESKAKEAAAVAEAREKEEEDAKAKAAAEAIAKEEAAIAEVRKKEEDAKAKAAAEAVAKEEAAIAEAREKEEEEAKAKAETIAKEEAAIAEAEKAKKDAAIAEAKAKEAAELAAKVREANKKKYADDAAKRAEIAKEVTEEQKKRRSAQDKALADADKAAEAAAIAAASELAKSDAAREAKLREIGDQAKKIVLEKAREAEEKLARINTRDTTRSVPAVKREMKPASEKSRPKKVEAAAKPRFGSKPAMKNVASSLTPKKVEAKDKPFWLQLLEKAQSEDDTTVSAPKKVAPKQKKKPAPRQQKKPAPRQQKKPAPKEKKTSVPAQKKSWGTFTIKPPKGKGNKLASTTAIQPVKKKESFSLFGNKSTPKKELKISSQTKAVKPAKKNSSFFGNKSTPKKELKISSPTKATPAKENSWGWGSFDIKSAKEKQSTPKVDDTSVGKKPWATPTRKKSNIPKETPVKSGTSSGNDFFSLFKSKPTENKKSVAPAKPAPKDGIPILSNWELEADGSITGEISNSPNFRNGKIITTSPARGIARSGRVVVTGSGSKYRLAEKR